MSFKEYCHGLRSVRIPIEELTCNSYIVVIDRIRPFDDSIFMVLLGDAMPLFFAFS